MSAQQTCLNLQLHALYQRIEGDNSYNAVYTLNLGLKCFVRYTACTRFMV